MVHTSVSPTIRISSQRHQGAGTYILYVSSVSHQTCRLLLCLQHSPNASCSHVANAAVAASSSDASGDQALVLVRHDGGGSGELEALNAGVASFPHDQYLPHH